MHGWKNVAMAYAILLLSRRFAQTGRAIRIRIQSVGYIYKRQANIFIFRSFLRQANNQITVRIKRQALHNNKRTKPTYKIDGAAARLHARVLVQINNIIGQKSGGGGGGGGGAVAPFAPPGSAGPGIEVPHTCHGSYTGIFGDSQTAN